MSAPDPMGNRIADLERMIVDAHAALEAGDDLDLSKLVPCAEALLVESAEGCPAETARDKERLRQSLGRAIARLDALAHDLDTRRRSLIDRLSVMAPSNSLSGER